MTRILSVEYPATLSRIPAYAAFRSSSCFKGRTARTAGVEAQASRLYALRWRGGGVIPYLHRGDRAWCARRGPRTVVFYRFLHAVRAAHIAGYRVMDGGDVVDRDGFTIMRFLSRGAAEAWIDLAWAHATS